jgi:hypothetical protein
LERDARIFATVGTLSLLGFADATIAEIIFLRHAVATEGRFDHQWPLPLGLGVFAAG